MPPSPSSPPENAPLRLQRLPTDHEQRPITRQRGSATLLAQDANPVFLQRGACTRFIENVKRAHRWENRPTKDVLTPAQPILDASANEPQEIAILPGNHSTVSNGPRFPLASRAAAN
jgi:hypothetical protein